MLPPDSARSNPIKENIRCAAKELGLDAIAFTTADSLTHEGNHLQDFLEKGYHGDMDWMERTAHKRKDPLALWNPVRSIIVTGINYGPQSDPLVSLSQPDRATISVYARNQDYHEVLKTKLRLLTEKILEYSGGEARFFVDTAPVMEKPLAAKSGLGWQGKHTNLVSRDFGSWLFLGVIFSSADLPPDPPETAHCGSCRACLAICPTQAFLSPYRLDARRCISYLTIEHKGTIPLPFRKKMGNRIYGCDDCLAACPWNKFAQTAREIAFQSRKELESPLLEELAQLDEAAFRKLFAGSPIKRIGRNRFLRNVLIAIGNSAQPSLLPTVYRLLSDPSALVRAMAVWALQCLLPQESFQILRVQFLPSEKDPEVCAEWNLLHPDSQQTRSDKSSHGASAHTAQNR